MALSKLPRDAVPLDAQEEAAWIESLQGDWDIEAVDLEAIAQVNNLNKYVKPIGFKTAKVTGKTYVMGGGPDGRSSKQMFSFTKSPSTGLVYLDEWGSMPMTPGWPKTRPMRGQVGEVFDIRRPLHAPGGHAGQTPPPRPASGKCSSASEYLRQCWRTAQCRRTQYGR